MEGTVTRTVAHVAQSSRVNTKNDSRLDYDGKTYFILQEQHRGYRNTGGSEKKQKDLSLTETRMSMDMASTHED